MKPKLVIAIAFLLGMAFGYCLAADDVAQAKEHRSQYPELEQGYQYYITTSTLPDNVRQEVIDALAFMMASTSSQPIVEYCTPQQVGDTLYHIDLRQLRWDYREWIPILKRYPYYAGRTWPLVVRADWLVVELSDAASSDTYYRLLYGKAVPRTMAEFRKFWKVGDRDKNLFFGMVEGKSGIAKQQTRWIENLPVLRGYYWQTKDTLQLDRDSDPLDNIDGNFHYDGQESILGIQKVSLKQGGKRGTLQVYFLAQGNRNKATADQKVDKADGDLVEDYTRFRARPQVRTAGSCIQCHVVGINEPTTNELREIIQIGVDVFAKGKELQQRLELFHLSDVGKEIARNQEDFKDGLAMANGLEPEENAKAFKDSITSYDAELTLEDAARELFSTAEELKLALAYASQVGGQKIVRSRLAALAHGKPIPRQAWEQLWRSAYNALLIWRQKP